MGTVGDSFFDTFQIVALALFLFIFSARSVHLRIRRHISPITLSLHKKGRLGIVEFGLFVAVNLWAAAVLLHTLPLDVQPFPSAAVPLAVSIPAARLFPPKDRRSGCDRVGLCHWRPGRGRLG